MQSVVAWALVSAAMAATSAGAAVDAGALQRGEQVYGRCAACHSIEANRTGPMHCGLFGRRAGSAPRFMMYSEAMRKSNIVWDANTLDRFLQDPAQAVPGTAMAYAGIKDPMERADLIAWLAQVTALGTTCHPPSQP